MRIQKDKIKKALCLLLSTFFAMSAMGCATKNASSVKLEDLYIPTYQDTGKHIITNCDTPPDMSIKEQAQLYKDAGFNSVQITEDFFSASDILKYGENCAYIRALKVCEELNIDAYIRPHSSLVSSKPTDSPCYYEKYFSTIDFRDYPAVKGFSLVDEPSLGQVQDLEDRFLPWFNENYGGENYEFYGNLFHSSYINSTEIGPSYPDYAEKYLSILDRANSVNKHFSIDYYALRHKNGQGYLMKTNLKSHTDAAERAKNHNMDFGGYVQVFGGGTSGNNTYRLPTTFNEVNWGVYNLLSLGATRLKFFLFREYKRDNLLGMLTDGVPNERYYFVQEALSYVYKMQDVLLSYKWDHIFTNVGTGSKNATNEAFEYVRDIAKPITNVEKVRSKYDITINEFTDASGNKAFMLFNYDEPWLLRNNRVVINLKKAEGVMYYRNGEPITQLLENGRFEISLEAGEGVFVIPLYKK